MDHMHKNLHERFVISLDLTHLHQLWCYFLIFYWQLWKFVFMIFVGRWKIGCKDETNHHFTHFFAVFFAGLGLLAAFLAMGLVLGAAFLGLAAAFLGLAALVALGFAGDLVVLAGLAALGLEALGALGLAAFAGAVGLAGDAVTGAGAGAVTAGAATTGAVLTALGLAGDLVVLALGADFLDCDLSAFFAIFFSIGGNLAGLPFIIQLIETLNLIGYIR